MRMLLGSRTLNRQRSSEDDDAREDDHAEEHVDEELGREERAGVLAGHRDSHEDAARVREALGRIWRTWPVRSPKRGAGRRR